MLRLVFEHESFKCTVQLYCVRFFGSVHSGKPNIFKNRLIVLTAEWLSWLHGLLGTNCISLMTSFLVVSFSFLLLEYAEWRKQEGNCLSGCFILIPKATRVTTVWLKQPICFKVYIVLTVFVWVQYMFVHVYVHECVCVCVCVCVSRLWTHAWVLGGA